MDPAKVNNRVEEWQIKQIREATNQRVKRDDGGNILTHPKDIKKGPSADVTAGRDNVPTLSVNIQDETFAYKNAPDFLHQKGKTCNDIKEIEMKEIKAERDQRLGDYSFIPAPEPIEVIDCRKHATTLDTKFEDEEHIYDYIEDFPKLEHNAAVPTQSIASRTGKMTKSGSGKRWSNKCIIITSIIVMCSVTTVIIPTVYTSNKVIKQNGENDLSTTRREDRTTSLTGIHVPTEDLYTTKTGNSTPKVSNISSCPTGLLQNNTLPDDAFSASSEFQTSQNVLWPAEFARLGHSEYWCSQQNSKKEGEWIQVDLGSVRKIYGIGVKAVNYTFLVTQHYYVTKFQFWYSTDANSTNWWIYPQNQPPKIFDGNHYPDQLDLVKHDLSEAVNARFVRIYIIDWEFSGFISSDTACTQIEFFGC